MFKDKVVLVTGSSRGIGRAIAIAFAKEGCKVVVNHVYDEQEAQITLKEIEKYSSGFVMEADVSNFEAIGKLKEEIVAKYGKLDFLINNAGIIAQPGNWPNITEQGWDKTFAVNTKGVFNCTNTFIPLLKQSEQGRVVNISSVVSQSANVGIVAYAASKAAVNNMTVSFSKALAPTITVNAIAPGSIDTDLSKVLSEDVKKYLMALTPMKRFGRPEEVADLCLFLCSDKAGYITGQVIEIAGGYTLR